MIFFEEHRGHGLEEEDVLLDCSEFRIGIGTYLDPAMSER